MASSLDHALVVAGVAACWGALVLVWFAGALYNASRGRRRRTRGTVGLERLERHSRRGVEHRLRTEGPYGVTRHPIYTGLLGMLLGTVLLVGFGHWLLLLPVGLVFIEIRIHLEEGLMLATFPEAYPTYRQRVRSEEHTSELQSHVNLVCRLLLEK